MIRFYITKNGLEKLTHELHQLRSIERPAIIEAISIAREFGDLSENAEYHSAKDKQGQIEARISDIENKISRAEIIEPAKMKGDSIKIGATVTLADINDNEETYIIVGDYDSDPVNKKISISTPIAKAMIGKKLHDEVIIDLPKGTKIYEVIKIEFNEI